MSHTNSCTETLLHTAAFAHRSSDTQKLLQTLLHTETLTHKQLCTFTHRCSYHTDAFTYTCFYTHTKLLHTHTQRRLKRTNPNLQEKTVYRTRTSFHAKGFPHKRTNRNLTQLLKKDGRHFVRKSGGGC